MAAVQWDPQCKVYVGGFKRGTALDKIVELCAKNGKVVDHGGLNRRREGMVVLYDSAATANAAVAALNGLAFEDTTVVANIARIRPIVEVQPSTNVYLAGFPLDAEDLDSTVRALAEPYGAVVDLDRIVRRARAGAPPPTSQAYFITFESLDSAVKAIQGLNGHVIGGATLVCEPRRSRPSAKAKPAEAQGEPAAAAAGGAKRKKRKGLTAARAAARAEGPLVVIKGLPVEADRDAIVAAVAGATKIVWSKRSNTRRRRRGDADDEAPQKRKTVFLELADDAAQAAALALSGTDLCGATVKVEEKKPDPEPEAASEAPEPAVGGGKKNRRRRRIEVTSTTDVFVKVGLPEGATEEMIKGAVKGSIGAAPRTSRAGPTVAVVSFSSEGNAAAFVARNGEDIFGAGKCELKFNRTYVDAE